MNELFGRDNYSLLDRPEILQFVFYPRREWTPVPSGASDFFVQVAEGVRISCRFYPAGKKSPNILFFHGNGEIACDYDGIAPLYNKMNIGLFVADYRGYGGSDGRPRFSDMIADAHKILEFFRRILSEMGHTGPFIIMGRSLGAHSALEIALNYATEIKGLIVESGAARMARLLSLLSLSIAPEVVKRLEATIYSRVHSLTTPVLIMHGEFDSLIPLGEAFWFHETLRAKVKQLVIISGADHNDIMLVGQTRYFTAIKDFLQLVAPERR